MQTCSTQSTYGSRLGGSKVVRLLRLGPIAQAYVLTGVVLASSKSTSDAMGGGTDDMVQKVYRECMSVYEMPAVLVGVSIVDGRTFKRDLSMQYGST